MMSFDDSYKNKDVKNIDVKDDLEEGTKAAKNALDHQLDTANYKLIETVDDV